MLECEGSRMLRMCFGNASCVLCAHFTVTKQGMMPHRFLLTVLTLEFRSQITVFHYHQYKLIGITFGPDGSYANK
jgi:hypothetical protein